MSSIDLQGGSHDGPKGLTVGRSKTLTEPDRTQAVSLARASFLRVSGVRAVGQYHCSERGCTVFVIRLKEGVIKEAVADPIARVAVAAIHPGVRFAVEVYGYSDKAPANVRGVDLPPAPSDTPAAVGPAMPETARILIEGRLRDLMAYQTELSHRLWPGDEDLADEAIHLAMIGSEVAECFEHIWPVPPDGDQFDPETEPVNQDVARAIGGFLGSMDQLQALRTDKRAYRPLNFTIKSKDAMATELADIVLRCFTYAGRRGIDLPAAIMAKAIANADRPIRHGGKNF